MPGDVDDLVAALARLDPGYDEWAGETDLIRLVPSPLDERVRTLVRAALERSPEEVATARGHGGRDVTATLATFVTRHAVAALRGDLDGDGLDGLRALALLDHTEIDVRYLDVVVAFARYATARAGGDPTDVQARLARLAAPEVAAALDRREALDPLHDLAWTGHREVVTRYGPGLVHVSFDRFAPTTDLVGLAVEVADALDAAGYPATPLTLGDRIPPRWFRPTRRTRASAWVAAAPAGAILGGRPRPGTLARARGQQVLAFLLEAAGPTQARRLAVRLARPALAVTRGSLLVAVVADEPGLAEALREPLDAALASATLAPQPG
ncbi:MAG: hypothetical protein AB7L84_02200 [Acidimicrobiia bacterium]